jgi:hypothetical protein
MKTKSDIYQPPASCTEAEEESSGPVSYEGVKQADRFFVLFIIQPIIAFVIIAVFITLFYFITLLLWDSKFISTLEGSRWVDIIGIQSMALSGLYFPAIVIRDWLKVLIPNDYRPGFDKSLNIIANIFLIFLFITFCYVTYEILID